MAGYEYNPLLKEGFQKIQDIPEPPAPITIDDALLSTSTNPVQNKVITAKLSEMEADTRKKITKFFNSIEELEIDEIGEYQGEPGGDFVPGYFYKRNPIVSINYGSNYEQSCSRVLEVMRGGDNYLTQYYKDLTAISSSQGMVRGDTTDGVYFILLSPEFLIANNLPIYRSTRYGGGSQLYDYYLFPYAVNLALNDLDYNNIVTVNNDNNIVYNGKTYTPDALTLSNGITCWLGFDMTSPHLFYVWLRCHVDIAFLTDKDLQTIVFDGNLQFETGQCHYSVIQTISITCTDYTFTENVPFVRVDTQPAINPSNFATSAQGAKADSALQAISKGTDGNYITTTVTAKDANNQQTVGASLTIQDIATADNTHKGLAEASNVKTYAATAAQGTKADTALQAISKGTDGNYITTTVTAKDANNQQTVGASLTIQDINTADNDHRGLLEALNTRNYIDTQIYNVSLNFFFYGVQWDENDPSPDCTRIGNMSLHAELPIQNAIIGGLLQDDLTFTPFPDQSDWSGETVDGSAGQVMMQIPKHYFKSEINGTIHKKLISQYPLAGFIEIPLMYISAEKATVDRTDPTTPKLCSVVNMSPEFRGGQNTADWDNTYRSLLGKPATNISLTNFRQYARNRAAGTAWNCHTYIAQRVLYWLFVAEYATLNSQKAFNAAKDANGYMQGGLGPGVSIWNGDAWNAYNSYNPLIPCGYMLEYGNQSAVKNYDVKDADDNVLVTFEVNSYRGIQSPFADIWDWTDGILINVQSDAAGGVSTCYITDDPAKFSSSDFSQYTELGNTPRADNWIKTIFDGEQGDIICKTHGGSSTSYYCDYYWGTNLPESGVSLRGVRFGGSAHYGSLCGFLSAYSLYGPGNVHPGIGSRLCAIPPP